MPTTRLYKVETKIGRKKQTFLAEATSQEQAIRLAVDPLVKSCTIPSPIETARLIGEGVQILTKANAQEVVNAAVESGQGELQQLEPVPWPQSCVIAAVRDDGAINVIAPWIAEPFVFAAQDAHLADTKVFELRQAGPTKEWLDSLPQEAQPVAPADVEIPPAGQHDA